MDCILPAHSWHSLSLSAWPVIWRAHRLEKVIIIGAGQAGLATAYHLQQHGIAPLLLDAHARAGDCWRNRWDSLCLFSPAKYSSLPGWAFPLPSMALPTKDQAADYLEAYAQRFQMRLRLGARVLALTQEAGSFAVVLEGGECLRAERIVIATGAFSTPYVPDFAQSASKEIAQIHVRDYRNPMQVGEGAVLVVGAGASGSQIAAELAATHKVYLCGPDTGNLPRRFLGIDIYWWLYASGVMAIRRHSWLGRRMAKQRGGDQLIGKPLKKIVADAGIHRRGMLLGFEQGKPQFQDGESADDIRSIVWATGYRNDYRWIRMPILDPEGVPVQTRGVVEPCPGLYFVGLRFMHRVDSSNMGGMGRDAAYIAGHIAHPSQIGSNRNF